VIRYIEEHRATFGVEPICRVLAIAPSSYYAARNRPPSAHDAHDQELAADVARVHAEQFGVYGARKVWRQLAREGIAAGRDRVARLMRGLGLAGVRRERHPRTTRPGVAIERPEDLVGRVFSAPAPNRLWVADITYVRLRSGFCYAAFVVDAFSRRIVGWRVALTLRADLALDALEMALWARGQGLEGLVHHSDRGIQYLAIRYTERLAEAGIAGSVGSRGDSYDNALAESVNALYKAELIHRRSWQTVDQVELATARWVEWWNMRRLHSACGNIPPAEFEAEHARRIAQASVAA
jgi:putative transposase